MRLFHATKVQYVPSIMRDGIKPRTESKRRGNWANPFGAKLGDRKMIYCFDALHDAVLWAAKMEFDLSCKTAVIEFEDRGDVWRRQEYWSHEGASLQVRGWVPPAAIRLVHVMRQELIHESLAIRRKSYEEGGIKPPS